MVAETDARRLRHKNAKFLWLATEESEHEARAKAATKVKADRIAKANERAAPTRSLAPHCSSSDDDDPPDADAKLDTVVAVTTTTGMGRRGNGNFLHPRLVI